MPMMVTPDLVHAVLVVVFELVVDVVIAYLIIRLQKNPLTSFLQFQRFLVTFRLGDV